MAALPSGAEPGAAPGGCGEAGAASAFLANLAAAAAFPSASASCAAVPAKGRDAGPGAGIVAPCEPARGGIVGDIAPGVAGDMAALPSGAEPDPTVALLGGCCSACWNAEILLAISSDRTPGLPP